MPVTRLHDVAAMRQEARRRLPRIAFDFVDGGAGRESALRRNAAALERIRLLPRVLAGAATRSQSIELFGRKYSTPFGIAPLGLANIVRPGTDAALAGAAEKAGIPYVLSTAATTSIEQIAAIAPNSWFQLYVGRDSAIVDDLIARVDAAGIPVLVVTADVPVPGKRLRDLVNGLSLPLRLSPRMLLDVLGRPGWLLRLLLHGAPRFANLERYAARSGSATGVAELMASQSSARLDWNLLQDIRSRWRRVLVLKGVMHPGDAQRALQLGVDGVIVSNHGGRQLDSAVAPIEILPAIRAAVGPGFPLLLDGGVRSGEDIARAIAVGANAVLLGRGFLFSMAALGPVGPVALSELLRDELDRALAQLGCSAVYELDRSFVYRSPSDRVPEPDGSDDPGRLRG